MTDYGLDVDSVGVPRGEGETWQELVDRRHGRDQEWFACVCGAAYRSRRASLRCCSDSARNTQPTVGPTDDDVRDALSSK